MVCLGPLAWLIWAAFTDNLSANPIDDITDTTGRWTLRFLLITLSITPLRRITGWTSLIRFRRMFGLFAFFHSILHFTTWILLDKFFDVNEMIKDVALRPFITARFTAFVLMIPLAVTSTRKWISRLGGRRWQALHRLIYVSAIGGVLHYTWLVKLDWTYPAQYAAVLALLLGYRVWTAFQSRPAASSKFPGQKQEAR